MIGWAVLDIPVEGLRSVGRNGNVYFGAVVGWGVLEIVFVVLLSVGHDLIYVCRDWILCGGLSHVLFWTLIALSVY